jgi:hypothetical protein
MKNYNIQLKILKFLSFFFIFYFLFFNSSVLAQTPNNKFGIHLAQPHLEDLKKVAELVNSNGGDWGYVTLVIQENDRDKRKWQEIFDLLRKYHLIPIVRLATSPVGENWRRPDTSDVAAWVDFLDSLNWVVKNRYVILFNEPNHGSEWGGEVDPKSYAQVVFAFSKALKEKNQDFFVMMAGFDASAPSSAPSFEDEELFLQKLVTNYPSPKTIFDHIDGWASHSYPNPGFSGSPYDFGRGTVRTYQWELNLLRQLGIEKDLPVFITETGWERKKLSEEQVAQNFKIAFEQVWLPDEKVKAVTPFVFDYQMAPFLGFSWKTSSAGASGGQEFYQQYYDVQSLNKVKGEPDQVEKGEISFDLPKELVAQSQYNFRVTLKNQGQAIWDKDEGYELRITNYGSKSTEVLVSDIKDIRPFEERSVDFSIKTNKEEPSQEINFTIIKDNRVIFESKRWKFKIDPLPELKVKVDFWPFGRGKGADFEVQLFDIDDRLIFKKKGVKVEKGEGVIKNIQNIAIDELYRAVILKPGYLPRQSYLVFKTKGNYVKFKSMLPFDFNRDGAFNIKDIFSLIRLLRNY